MLRELGMCVVLVAISAGLAVATNVFRADEGKRLPWIRRGLPVQGPDVPPVDAGAATESGDAAGLTDSRGTDASGTTPVTGDAPGASDVTMDDVLAAMAGNTAYFVDAREKAEYVEGHLRGAVNLPSSAIYESVDAVTAVIPPDARVIVYCGGGQCEASHNVSDALRRDFGYQNVVIYTKGWEEVLTSGRFAELIARGEEP